MYKFDYVDRLLDADIGIPSGKINERPASLNARSPETSKWGGQHRVAVQNWFRQDGSWVDVNS
jgi:hypothetical protein